MSGTVYRLLGIVVWRALKWYVRERLPLRRVTVAAAATLAVLGGAAAGLVRRANGG